MNMVIATASSHHCNRHMRLSAADVTARLRHLVTKLSRHAHALTDLREDGRLGPIMCLGVEHLVSRSRGGGRSPIARYEPGRARLASIRPVVSNK